MEPTDEQYLKEVLMVNAIEAKFLYPKSFDILCWRQIERLCKAEDLCIHFGHKTVHGIRFREIIGHFTIADQWYLLSAYIQL